MTNNTDNLLGYLRVMVAAWRDDPRGDAELLGRFAEAHDEAAFAALVGRHGSLVWQTCRRLLGDTPDAEDAFQATFLALARKAGTFPVESLAGWLHRVAWQAALKSRLSARRRRGLVRQLWTALRPASPPSAGRDELYAVLDEELVGLPERLRVPLVLRYLEGNTLEQVARVLGCSRRALGKRLAKGEAILRERLARRGLTVGGAAVAALFAGSDGAAAVPARLIGTTARAAVAFRAGELTGAPAEGARAVLRGLPERALLRKGWWVVVACVCSIGASVAAWQPPVERPDAARLAAVEEAVHSADAANGEPAGTDRFGDPLPAGAVARMGTTRWRHVTGPTAFTTDGKAFFTSGLLWDAATGKQLRRLRDAYGHPLRCMSVSANGRLIAALAGTGSAGVWEAATGKLLREWGTDVTAIVLSPDGNTVRVGSLDRHLRVWDVPTGKTLRDWDLGAVVDLFSPDGKVAAATPHEKNDVPGNYVTQLWDATTGTQLSRIARAEPWESYYKGAAFSPDGKVLAVGSGVMPVDPAAKAGDGSVCLWDVATGKELRRTAPDPSGTYSVAFSPDGKLLATGSGFGPVRFWDAATCKPAGVCKGYRSNVTSLAFSPDGATLATLSELHENIVRLWEVASGKEKTPPTGGHTGSILSVAFLPGDKTIVSGGRDGSVRLWDADTGGERRPPLRGGEFQAVVAPSSDAGTIVSVGSDFAPAGGQGALMAAIQSPATVRVWDAATGRELRHFAAPGGGVQGAALSPDGKVLATVGAEDVTLWDFATGKPRHRLAARPTCVAFSPDGKTLAVESVAGPLSLWAPDSGKKICDLPRGKTATGSYGLAFSPDGRTLAAGELEETGVTIRLWRRDGDGNLAADAVIPTRHRDALWALAFSPDGQALASAGTDGTVCLWETATGGERRHFTGRDDAGQPGKLRDDSAWSLSFSGDGRRLAAGNSDTTVLVWDVTGRLADGHRLRPATLSDAELQALWADLAGADAARADRAVWALAAAPEQALPPLRQHLRPVPRPGDVKERVDRCIADLDNDAFTVRQAAEEELRRLGEAAETALRAAEAKTGSIEVRSYARRLLGAIKAARANPSSDALRSFRAVRVLGQSGTPEARRLLDSLVGGAPDARLTQEARAVARTLHPPPAAAKP
jgi:RNA polymerase sigma factor (sigma-70 family)